MLPWILCGVLMLANLLLLYWVHYLHSDIEDICSQFDQRLREDTNNLIYVPSQDPYVRRLAAQLCLQLELLRRQRNRYETGDQELKETISNISHDLRTPLTSISGYLELLERDEQSEDLYQTTSQDQLTSANQRTSRSRYLFQIRNRTEAMKELIEQLFAYSLSISLPPQQPEELTLNNVLEESLASCYAQLTEAGIVPQIQIPETPVRRTLDKVSLERIFSNILGNVAKYSAGDLAVCLSFDGEITFSNSAPNLTPVMVERLFDRYYTVETARHSTGLGLSIAKALTEHMEGTIAAFYREGQLTVRLRFPKNGI